MLEAVVHTADIQDRAGGPAFLSRIRNRFPWLVHIFADGGYAGIRIMPGAITLTVMPRSAISSASVRVRFA